MYIMTADIVLFISLILLCVSLYHDFSLLFSPSFLSSI